MYFYKKILLKLNLPKINNLCINTSKHDLNKLYSNNYRGMKNKPKNLMDCKLSKKYLQMFHFRTGLSMDEAEKEINDLLYKKYNNFINHLLKINFYFHYKIFLLLFEIFILYNHHQYQYQYIFYFLFLSQYFFVIFFNISRTFVLLNSLSLNSLSLNSLSLNSLSLNSLL